MSRTREFNDPVMIVFKCESSIRELARTLEINTSKICREALEAHVLGELNNQESFDVSTKPVLDKYAELLEWKQQREQEMMHNITMLRDIKLQQQQQIVNSEQYLNDIQDVLDRSGGVSKFRRYLPEEDFHGNYMDASRQLASEISGILHTRITTEQLHEAIREGCR